MKKKIITNYRILFKSYIFTDDIKKVRFFLICYGFEIKKIKDK